MTERLSKQLHINRDTFRDTTPFVPYHTDDEALEQRRRIYHDTVADMQYRGLTAAHRLREESFASATSTLYVDELLERLGTGTAHHSLIESSDTMYSQFQLAHVAGGPQTDRWYKTPDILRTEQSKHLAIAAELAYYFRVATRNNDPDRAHLLARGIGHRAGNAAMLTTGIALARPMCEVGNPVDIQRAVRDGSMEAVHSLKGYAAEIGALPSAAQLVEPDSPLAVDIRRNAPRDVRRSLGLIVADLPEQPAA